MNGAIALRWEDIYRHEGPGLRILGRLTASTHEFRRYMQVRVRERLRRSSSREQLREYVSGLASTGFATTTLDEVSIDKVPLAPWEIGEVLAEVLLEDTEQAEFPWPPSWDKRSATASLPGPDLIGFLGNEGSESFLFGEVKASDADDVHASVIRGSDGLRRQIERLLSSEDRRQLLISWLWVRVRGGHWQPKFDRCLAAYLASPSQGVVVGILLRGREPNETDLQPAGAMADNWGSGYRLLLLGLLPSSAAQ